MTSKIKSLLKIQKIEQELRQQNQTSPLELIQELANTRMGVPTEFIRSYDRAKRRYSDAVVRLHNGVCQGCFMTASTNITLIAKAGKSIHICEHCSRLVYCEAPEAEVKN